MHVDSPIDKTSIQFSLELNADVAARWLYARDGVWPAALAQGDAMPMSWAVFLRLQPVLCRRIHDLLNRDPDRGLYGGVVYRSTRTLRIGDVLDAQSQVTDRREMDSPRGRLTVTTLATRYAVAGRTVLEESVQMIDLPKSVADPGARATRATDAPRSDPSLLGSPIARLEQGFDRSRIAWMTAATGDTNPLHLDRPYAQRRGFDDVVVPAPLITAWVEHQLSNHAGGQSLTHLELRYQGPTLPEQALEIHLSDPQHPERFEVRCAGLLRARGRYATA